MSEIKIVKSWDSMPPVLYDGAEAFSTRLLERKYRLMQEAMEEFVDRVDKGEVRSKYTYTKFKEILST